MTRIAPPDFLADPALQAVLAALPGARLVGGCVRDALAGVKVADIDLATPDVPGSVMAALAAKGLRGVPTGISHGTVTAVSGGRGFQVTTLRHDVETDGRHALVAFSDDWQQDAARRDFTFNALSMTPAGEVHDYFGGIADLRAGRVRFVGDPAARVAEDRLRVLRYFRFFARYSALPRDAEAACTMAALREADLSQLSAERIWAELKRILAVPDPRAVLRLMDTLGVLRQALPFPYLIGRLDPMIAAGAPADALLRLAALLKPSLAAADAAQVASRFRFSNVEAARLKALLDDRIQPQAEDSDDSARRLLAEVGRDVALDLVWLACPGRAWLRARLAALPPPVFPLVTADLGLPEGRKIGMIRAVVRHWWLMGGCRADRAACAARALAVAPDFDDAE